MTITARFYTVNDELIEIIDFEGSVYTTEVVYNEIFEEQYHTVFEPMNFFTVELYDENCKFIVSYYYDGEQLYQPI